MKIDREHFEQAYQVGRILHQGKIEFLEAQNKLIQSGLNPSSGRNLLRNLGHMLRGENYRRKMSIPATKHYLSSIYNDDGDPGLAMALQSLRQHINYYTGLYGDPMQGHQDILDSYEPPATFDSPEEVPVAATHTEGSVRQVLVNAYERSSSARKACLVRYGYACSVCGFDFGKTYGSIGKEFIHVHHLREIATIAEKYQVDPVKDLRPVCPNCHAMLHRKTPAYTIDELKRLILPPA